MELVGKGLSGVEAPGNISEIERQASLIRAEIGAGRSETMLRLFDYLLECSAKQYAPKEMEVFHAVFAQTGREAGVYDSAVRTYIHRLRRKMDVFYADRPGPRLAIPKGEYRITLIQASEQPEVPEHKKANVRWSDDLRRWPVPALISLAGLGLLMLIVLSWIVIGHFGAARSNAAETALWQPYGKDNRSTVVVVGDYYLVGKSVDGVGVTHLLRDFSINSHDDLEQHLMQHPADMGRYIDVNLSYFPTSAGAALDSVIPIVKSLDGHKSRPSSTIALSRLEPDALKQSNIVYLGLLSGLGILRGPLFQASGFAFEASYEELIDTQTRKTFRASRGIFDDKQSPQIDFAYLAAMPGPADNRILVIAGTRDPAAIALSRLVADPAQIDALLKRTGGTPNFEALYQVRSMGGTIMGSNLVVVRPLKAQRVWNGNITQQEFPDSTPKVGGLEDPGTQ